MCCCCLCKNTSAVKEYRKYQEARKRLSKELDLFQMVKGARTSKMVNKVLLNGSQRNAAWQWAKGSTVTSDECAQKTYKHPLVPNCTNENGGALNDGHEKMRGRLQIPVENPWDIRLLYELTGIKPN